MVFCFSHVLRFLLALLTDFRLSNSLPIKVDSIFVPHYFPQQFTTGFFLSDCSWKGYLTVFVCHSPHIRFEGNEAVHQASEEFRNLGPLPRNSAKSFTISSEFLKFSFISKACISGRSK